MQTFLLIFFSTLMIAVLIAIYFLYKKFNHHQKNREPQENLFVMIQNQIQELNRVMEHRMTETNKTMNDTQLNLNKTIQRQFNDTTKVITDITEKLTSLDKTNLKQDSKAFWWPLTSLA